MKRLSFVFWLLPQPAAQYMVIYHAGGLHMRVDNGTAHKLKAPFFKVFTYGIAKGRSGRYLPQCSKSIYYRLAISKRPKVRTKTAKLLLHLYIILRVSYGGKNL